MNYVKNKNGEIVDREWRLIGKDKRKTPFFLIRCDKTCIYDCDKRSAFWINKYEFKPSKRHQEGKWCPYRKINKSLNRHQMDIEFIVKNRLAKYFFGIIIFNWKLIFQYSLFNIHHFSNLRILLLLVESICVWQSKAPVPHVDFCQDMGMVCVFWQLVK